MKSLLVGTLLMSVACGSAWAQAPATPPTPPTEPTTPPAPAGTPAQPPAPKSPMLRPQVNPKLKPVPQATLFNSRVDVKTAIDAAKKRGAAERRRVLIIWGDNTSRWALRMQEALEVPETARQIRYHYELVLAEVAGSAFGPLNLAMAQTFGATISPAPNLKPYITVLETIGDDAGKPLVNRSSAGMERPGATKVDGSYNAVKVQEFLSANKAPRLEGNEVMDQAKARARSRGMPLFVFFNDLEDPWCTKFANWLKRDDVMAVLSSRFEVVAADFLRWKGGTEVFNRFGGEQSEAAPWYLVLDPEEKRLAPDADNGEKDLGFPTGDEIKDFVKMLRRVAPAMTEDDGNKLAATLEAKPAAAGGASGGKGG